MSSPPDSRKAPACRRQGLSRESITSPQAAESSALNGTAAREVLNLTSPRGARAWGDDDRMDAAAVHEAGHAVARLALGLPFRYVTIRRRGGLPGEGYVAVHTRRLVGMDAMRCGVSLAAGPEAERRHYVDQGYAENADCLLQMSGGCTDDDAALAAFPDGTEQGLRQRATLLLAEYWPAVLALADRMLTDPATLTYGEARRIVGELSCWPEHLR